MPCHVTNAMDHNGYKKLLFIVSNLDILGPCHGLLERLTVYNNLFYNTCDSYKKKYVGCISMPN